MAQRAASKAAGKITKSGKKSLRVVAASGEASPYAKRTLFAMKVAVRRALIAHAAKGRKVFVIKDGRLVQRVPDHRGKVSIKATASGA